MRGQPVWAAALLLAACGGPQRAGKAGDDCFRDDDCAYGLICAVPNGKTRRVCTADVSSLVVVVDAGVPPNTGGEPPATGGASSAGSNGTGGGDGAGGTTNGTGGDSSTAGQAASPTAGTGNTAGAPP